MVAVDVENHAIAVGQQHDTWHVLQSADGRIYVGPGDVDQMPIVFEVTLKLLFFALDTNTARWVYTIAGAALPLAHQKA
jgi:hypothetical protein